MSDFSIRINEMKVLAEHLGEIADSLNAQATRIDELSDSLGTIGLGALKLNFIGLVHSLRGRSRKATGLQNALYRIIALFLQAEQEILGLDVSMKELLEEIWEKIQEYYHKIFDREEFRMDSVVFDDKGSYGCNQGHPEVSKGKKREKLYDIIRENVPDHEFIDDELEIYLKRANDEGCGYAAAVSSIFVAFEDDPDAFERIFGYPMYVEKKDKNGKTYKEPNYDMLFIDLYSSMDNIDPETGEFDIMADYDKKDDGSKKKYNYWNDEIGNGVDSDELEYYYEEFLRQHDVVAEYHQQVDVTPSNVQELIESGQTIIITYEDGYLENADGDREQKINCHAMVVTGVTDDGRYIVSSWGEEYYIDPHGEYPNATMYFDTVEITSYPDEK